MKKEKVAKGPDAALGPVLLRPLNVPQNASFSTFLLNVHVPLLCRAFPCPFLPEALVDLMSVVVRLCPSVCENGHFAVLLGAYGASLSVLGEDVTGSVWGPGGRCDQGGV